MQTILSFEVHVEDFQPVLSDHCQITATCTQQSFIIEIFEIPSIKWSHLHVHCTCTYTQRAFQK